MIFDADTESIISSTVSLVRIRLVKCQESARVVFWERPTQIKIKNEVRNKWFKVLRNILSPGYNPESIIRYKQNRSSPWEIKPNTPFQAGAAERNGVKNEFYLLIV